MQVIYADDLQTVREAMYGVRSDALINDLRAGLQQRDQSILTELGRRYDADVEKNFEMVSGWNVVNAARKAVAGLQGFDAPNVILPLFDDDSMQKAPVIMQRFLMSDEVVRQAYQKKRIDGWSDTYVDNQPGVIGHDQYDHRVIRHGIVERKTVMQPLDGKPDEEVAVEKFVSHEFFHDLKPHDAEITASNRLDNFRSTMFLRSKLHRGMKDLTSLFDENVS